MRVEEVVRAGLRHVEAVPKAYSDLTEGKYVFCVRAIDAAASSDPTPATRSFTLTNL